MNHKYILAFFLISFLCLGSACKKSEVDIVKYSPSSPIMFYRLGQGATLTSMQQTADGGNIFCGYEFSGASKNTDGFLLKTDSRGVTEWEQVYGGSGDDEINKERQTSDGGYVMVGNTSSYGNGAIRGDYYGDAWIVKTDALGNMLWQKTAGDILNDDLYDVVEMPDQSLVTTGYGQFVNPYYGAYTVQVYVIKLDPSGNILLNGILPQMQKYYRSNASGIAITPTGFALIGRVVKSNYAKDQGILYPFVMSVGGSSGNTILWSQIDSSLGTSAVVSDIVNSGDGLVMAVQSNDTGGNIQAFKTDFNGALKWDKKYKTSGANILTCFCNNSNGGFLLGGNSPNIAYSGHTPYLLSINSSGDVTDEMDVPVQYNILGIINAFPTQTGFDIGLSITNSVVNGGNQFGLANIDKNGKLTDYGK